MFNKKLMLFPMISVLELMFGTAKMEVKLPFTSSHSVAWLSAISLLFYSFLLSWRHYLCGGAVCFNQGMLGNTWDNISTIYGYFSL